jgi:hypothetical protein
MARRRLAVAALSVLAVASACSGGSSGDEARSSGSDGSAGDEAQAEVTSTTLDDSPFCQDVRALVALGDDPGDPTPDAVLAQSQAMRGLLDEISASSPPDAPDAVAALLSDFRTIADAVTASGGDVDAAYAALEAEQPELWARLAEPTAHDDGFRYFADHCGTPLP